MAGQTIKGTAGNDTLSNDVGVGLLEGLGGNDTYNVFIPGQTGVNLVNLWVSDSGGTDKIDLSFNPSIGINLDKYVYFADIDTNFDGKVDSLFVSYISGSFIVQNYFNNTAATAAGSSAGSGLIESFSTSYVIQSRLTTENLGYSDVVTRIGNGQSGISPGYNLLGSSGNDSLEVWGAVLGAPLVPAGTVAIITGNAGNDTLNAYAIKSWQLGGAGNDTLKNDTRNYGATLDGGVGDDTYIGNVSNGYKYPYSWAPAIQSNLVLITDAAGTDSLNVTGATDSGSGMAIKADWLAFDTNFNGNLDALQIKFYMSDQYGKFTAAPNTFWILNYFNDSSTTLSGSAAGSGAIESIQFGDKTLNYSDVIQRGSILMGTTGNDTLTGTDRNDVLNGLQGTDVLIGGGGDDTLIGSLGGDTYQGGAGNDTYDFRHPNSAATYYESYESPPLHYGNFPVYASLYNYFGQYFLGSQQLVVNDTSGSADILYLGQDLSYFYLQGLDTDNNGFLDALALSEWKYNPYSITFVKPELTSNRILIQNYFNNTSASALGSTAGAGNIETVAGLSFTDVQNRLTIGQSVDGSSGADTMQANDGNDTLKGLAGNDVLEGRAGNDSLTGGAGDDTLNGGVGNDTYDFTGTTPLQGRDVITDTDGAADVLKFNQSKATVTAASRWIATDTDDDGNIDALNILAYSSSGGINVANSILINNFFSDDSDDIEDVTAGTGAIENIVFSDTNVTFSGIDDLLSAVTLTGTAGNDTLFGGTQNDSLSGLAGNDLISAGSGNDTVNGAAGNDMLKGGKGNDTYVFTAGVQGNDTITDVSGTDSLTFSAKSTDFAKSSSWEFLDTDEDDNIDALKINVYLSKGKVDTQNSILIRNFFNNTAVAAGDSAPGTGAIENFVFTGNSTTLHYADVIALSQILSGGKANDTLRSADGDDSISGNAGNDSLISGIGEDTLDGGAGSDTLIGGADNDLYKYTAGLQGVDIINDISGTDSISFAGSAATVQSITRWAGIDTDNDGNLDALRIVTSTSAGVLNLANSITIQNFFNDSANTAAGSSAGDGAIENFEYTGSTQNYANVVTLLGQAQTLQGSALADVIWGADGNDSINGRGGNDEIYGGAGNDTLNGADGNDTLKGGIGNDTYRFSATVNTVSVDGNNIIEDTSGDADVLSFAANSTLFLNGTSWVTVDEDEDGFVDGFKITAKSGNVLDPTRSLLVRNYFDDSTAIVGESGAGSGSIESIEFLNTTLDFDDVVALLAVGQTIVGTAKANILSGGNGNDTISGLAGNDLLFGGASNDSLTGGPGNDTLWGGTGNDTYNYANGSEGNEVIYDVGGTDTISFNFTSTMFKTFTRFEGVDTDNNNSIDALKITGLVNGLPDAKNSFLIHHFFNNNAATNATSTAGLGAIENWVFTDGTLTFNDIRQIGKNFTGTKANESFLGADGNDTLNGVAGNDTILGADGHDSLLGGDGNDYLIGNAGNDTLAGGAGSDTLIGAAGNDRYDYTDGIKGNDVIQDFGDNDDTDVLAFADTAETIYANTNWMALDTDNDTYLDALRIVVLNAKREADPNNSILIKDFFNDDATTLAESTRGFGAIETFVFSDTTQQFNDIISLGLNLTGNSSANNLTGGTGNDSISGLSGNDTLAGDIGNDTLVGGAGNDYLVGGDGNDLYKLSFGSLSLAGANTIRDTSGTDSISIQSNRALFESRYFWFDFDADYDGNVDTLVLVLKSAKGMDISSSVTIMDYFDNSAVTAAGSGAGSGAIESFIFNDQTLTFSDVQSLLATPVSLNGSNGNDSLMGRDGNDTLNGGDGNDYLYGGAGNDLLTGGKGTDTLLDAAGDDTYGMTSGLLGQTVILDLSGSDTLQVTGLSANGFQIQTRWSAFSADGDANLDSLQITQLTSGGALDTQKSLVIRNFFDNSSTSASGSSAGSGAIETFLFADSETMDYDDVVALLGNSVTLTGTAGNDSIYGIDGDDSLSGLAGQDLLFGGAGNDTMTGGTGNDTLNGGAGHDTYNYSSGPDGNEVVIDAGGADMIVLNSSDASTFETNTSWIAEDFDGNGKVDALRIRVLTTNKTVDAKNSIYIHNFFDNTEELGSASGAGEGAIESFSYSDQVKNFASVAAVLQQAKSLSGGAGSDILTGGEGNDTLTGLAGNDLLKGGVGADSLLGGDGNDTLYGDAGNDTYDFSAGVKGIDVINDTAGSDSIKFNVTFDQFKSQFRLTVVDGDTEGKLRDVKITPITSKGLDKKNAIVIQNVFDESSDNPYESGADDGMIENFIFNGSTKTFSEVLTVGSTQTGDTKNNVLRGLQGYDSLNGGAGNDTLVGSFGNDTLVGGLGNDLLSGDSENDTYDYTAGLQGSDIILDSAGEDDVITFDVAKNTFFSQHNFEAVDLSGNGNVDALRIISLSDSTKSITIQNYFDDTEALAPLSGAGVGAIERIVFDGDTLTFEDVAILGRTIIGTSNSDTLIGTGGADSISGLADSDTLDGGGGDDTLNGGIGDDFMVGGLGNDTFIFASGFQGNDTISDVSGTDTISFGSIVKSTFLSESRWVGVDTNNDGNIDALKITRLVSDSPDADNSLLILKYFDNTSASISTAVAPDGYSKLLLFSSDETVTFEEVIAFPQYLVGTALEDSLTGGSANDSALGLASDDTLNGLAGSDTLDGGSGNDLINGGDNNDSLLGGSGDDTIDGGNGNDVLSGGLGNDSLTGGAGSDMISGEAANDTLLGSAGDDNIAGDAGDDNIDAGDDNDTVLGGTGSDTIAGGAGNDMLYGHTDAEFTETDANSINGGTGDDTIKGASGNDTLDGGEGHDDIVGYHGADTLTGGAGNDTLMGGTGVNDTEDSSDSLSGGDGNDELFGVGGDDTLDGGAGDDDLSGGTGNDSMMGGADDDTYYVNDGLQGADTIIDASGDDWLIFSGNFEDFYGATTWQAITTDEDSFVDALKITSNSNAGNSLLIKNFFSNTATSVAGSTAGTGEIENLYFGDGTLGYNDVAALFENAPTEGDDTLTGTIGDDTIDGLGGKDSISGLAGGDNLIGGNGDDTLTGGDGNDTLEGGDGHDLLYGDAYGDQLDGGNGNDTLHGGTENDTYLASSGTDVIVDSDGNTDVLNLGANDFEDFTITAEDGSDGDSNLDTLVFSGPGGMEIRIENFFNNNGETVDEVTAGSGMIESFVFQDQTVSGSYSNIMAAFFPDEVGSGPTPGNDNLTGTGNNDNIDALAGNDTVDGLAGNDTLTGSEGDDSLLGGEGNDSLTGGDGNDTLLGGEGDDYLVGGAGNDYLVGGEGVDYYIFYSPVIQGADIINDVGGGEESLTIAMTLALFQESFTVEALDYNDDEDSNVDALKITSNADSANNLIIMNYFDNTATTAAASSAGAGVLEYIDFTFVSFIYEDVIDTFF